MPGVPETTQNMFQEGLHQVFFKERPLPNPVPADESTAVEPMEDRLVRWFGTVVNTHLLLAGVMTLMGLNIFNLLFAVCSFITFFVKSSLMEKATPQQRVGVYVLKGSGIVAILQCMLATIYMLFLIWKGMKSYSGLYRQDYITVIQPSDEHADPLLENEQFSL
ncbi:Centrosome-associated protein CEP250 [Labeo rohita]|uniref:Centrosome-associated protein CEP250 n=1 Tax=Labeo rohita TaxID=84645 RepID=A0ABQ8LRX8_LABRO|nr:Centrosome-associated protein CEP250 [Labeo rohita]